MFTRVLLITLLGVSGSRLQAQQPATESRAREWSAQATKLALAEVKAWDIRVGDADGPRAKLTEQPVLKWENPYEASVYGSSFVWMHAGRPAAMACAYKFFTTKKEFSVEFHSLADEPLTALKGGQVLWRPEKAGVEFKRLTAAAAPARSAPARMAQMRNLAREFSADVTIWTGTNHNLRLMPNPLLRYGDGSGELIDGAIFAWSRASDPDVLLLLEASAAEGAEPDWNYALARMHGGKLKVRYREEEVWSAEALAPPYYQKTGGYTTFQNIPEPEIDP